MELDLPTQTDRRLRAAGITEDDPGLAFIREWNAAAYAKAMEDPEYREAVRRQDCDGTPPV